MSRHSVIQTLGSLALGSLLAATAFAQSPKQLDRAPSSETPAVREPSGAEPRAELILKSANDCLTVSFDSLAGQIVSCTDSPLINYTLRACDTADLQESGQVRGAVSCDEKNVIGLRFKTGKGVVFTRLKVNRETQGRTGVTAHYLVDSTTIEPSTTLPLAEPVIKPVSGKQPEESPLQFKFSGFAWVEHEFNSNFGYDQGDGATQAALPNFDPASPERNHSNTSFFTNLNFEIAKDQTKLVSVLEVGELYFGEDSSGGAIGGRKGDIVEVRNLYLSHQPYEWLELQAGLITTVADPRSFIFNDHLSSIHLNYTTDLSEGTIFWGKAVENLPGTPDQRDQYLGLTGGLSLLSGLKTTMFGLYRSTNDTFYSNEVSGSVTGNSSYLWAGGTFGYEGFDPLNAELTLIGNWGTFRSQGLADDHLSSYLADAKLSYALPDSPLGISLEALLTPGEKDATDASGNLILGKRKNFVSPVASSYLLSVATSDGIDDAPGTPKQSIIANLNQPEGLQVYVLTLTANIAKRVTTIARYGYLMTSEKSSVTDSAQLGQEADLELVYQMNPSTILQLDYGRFFPGKFFQVRKEADLAAIKMKFMF